MDEANILLSLLQFQQLKQQQLMQQQQQRRGLKANNNKIAGHVDLSPSAWPNQPQRRDGSAMRAVFLGDRTGKPRSTGTGVFLPRRVNHTDAEFREKPSKVSMILFLIYFGSSHKFSDCVLFGGFSSFDCLGSG